MVNHVRDVSSQVRITPVIWKGIVLNLGSAFAFYAATIFVKGSIASPETYAFVRNFLGLLAMISLILIRKESLQGLPFLALSLRAIFNTLAVFTFYRSVHEGSAAKGNVLNMSYPVFVALFSGPILHEYITKKVWIIASISAIGIGLQMVAPFQNSGGFSSADIWGISSGVFAGLAVVYLRGAAKVAQPSSILLWMFGFGSCFFLPFCIQELPELPMDVWKDVLISSLCGAIGQWLLTASYSHIPAMVGSIVSSARIPIAVLCGALFLAEGFEIYSWIGALLLLVCNVFLATKSKNPDHVAQGQRSW